MVSNVDHIAPALFATDDVVKDSAAKVLGLMKMSSKVLKAYRERLQQLTLAEIVKIQRMVRASVARSLRKQGWIFTSLTLEGPNCAHYSSVEVFGEFTRTPWGTKTPCRKVQGKTWRANAWIRVGHRFKFVIDDGVAYTVSQRYS